MSQLPFTTRALYDYKSDFEDDLTFAAGQLIKVTAIEDDEWFSGEYTDGAGVLKSGIFPKNFVSDSIAEQAPAVKSQSQEESTELKPAEALQEEEFEADSDNKSEPLLSPVEAGEIALNITSQTNSVESDDESTPIIAVPTSKTEPAEPSLSEAFSSRKSTFDSGAPVPSPLSSFGQPHKSDVKPYQGHSSYIPPSINKVNTPLKIKPDLSHSSYVPPKLGSSKPQQEKPAPPPVTIDATNDHVTEEEEGPKMSLKERIALLQKQQAEEAERQAVLATKKKQQKEAKAVQSAHAAQVEDAPEELDDQSGAIGTTHSHEEEELEPTISNSIIPPSEHVVNCDEEESLPEAVPDEKGEGSGDDDDDEDEDEDEEDEEEAKRAALRERMAKLAGAGGMFGAPGGFNPFGMPTGASSAKKTSKKNKADQDEEQYQGTLENVAPVPILPFASGSAPQIPDMLMKRPSVVEDEDDKEQATEAALRLEEDSTSESSEADNETVKAESPVDLEEEVDEVDEVPTPNEPEQTLTEKLEKLDIVGTPRNILSESAVEGDDEGEYDDKSSGDEMEFSEQDRQKEIEQLNLDNKVTEPEITQSVQSDYTTGYESDYDTQYLKSNRDTSDDQTQSAKPFVSEIAPIAPDSAAPVTPSKRAPPPPSPASLPNAPPSVPAPAAPSIPSVPPPLPQSTPVSAPPRVPATPAGPPPIPSSVLGAPPPIPTSLPPAPNAVHVHYDHQDEGDHEDVRSINSSIISHNTGSPSTPFFSQNVIPENDSFTPSRPLRKNSTGTSTFSNTSQRFSHYAPPPPAPVGGPPVPELGIRKASTFSTTGGSSTSNSVNGINNETIEKYELKSKWWLRNELPMVLQSKVNKDLIFEVDENNIPRRDGTSLVVKSFYILHQDNSQTALHLSYTNEDSLTSFEALSKPTPAFSEAFLDAHSKDFGSQVLQIASRLINQQLSTPLIPFVFSKLGGKDKLLPNVGLRSYGATIYTNINNTEVTQLTQFRPGDIIAINKAKFQGHNKLRQKVLYDVGMDKSGPFAAILSEFDYDKKKFRVIEVDANGKVKQSSYKPSDMKSGKIKVFRPVDRGYVNW